MLDSLSDLEKKINSLYTQSSFNDGDKKTILNTIELLDSGKIRVCSFEKNRWQTHDWVKKSILLYFKIQNMNPILSGDLSYYDKIPAKKITSTMGVRSVPLSLARYGSHLEKNVILMPSFVNIGAYVAEGTMVDTWATVGSCAQIGRNVHLSGGVGIGGVLEPVQAQPVIIEDNVFIGSRAIIVEGTIVKQNAVIGAGVVITASTKIIDVTSSEAKEYKGLIPENSVVIPGNLQKTFPAGSYGVPCALIIGKRKESTDKKLSLNEALRDYGVSV